MSLPGARQLLDAHVHIAAHDDGSNGCFVSPRLRRSLPGLYFKLRLGRPYDAPATELNERYLARLLAQVRSSRSVGRVVGLALDAVHRGDGSRDLEASSLVVSNDYVLSVARRHSEILAGASVHPARPDALDELVRVKAEGAVLVKLLAVSQLFDPADPRFKPYWRKCAELGLPLLMHTGCELTLAGHVQRFGDPARLEAALAEGATVIAAHACSRGLPLGEKYLPTFRRLAQSYEHFLADTAALTLPSRLPMLLKLRREPELQGRLTFATDYPVPPTSLPLLVLLSPTLWWRAAREPNPFDKPARVIEALGLPLTSRPLEEHLGRQTDMLD